MWRFFNLVEQDKYAKKIKIAVCKIIPDTSLTYAYGTSNLMHHLEAKHPNKYCKAKSKESNESNKPMKQTSLPVCSSVKRCSSAHSKEINTVIGDFVALDLRPIAVVDGHGFSKLLTCLEPGYTFPSRAFVMNSLKQHYRQHFKAEASRIYVQTKFSIYYRYTYVWTSRATDLHTYILPIISVMNGN